MKNLIIFLLYCISGFSQENRLTAYRLINPHEDGPCSVKNYVKYVDTDFHYTYVTAESNDKKLIENIIAIKKESKSWESKSHFCNDGILGGDPITNMIVIMGKINDTIFMDSTNRWIIIPDENKAYFDKQNQLKSSFTGIIKEFFEHDFETRVRAMYLPEVDSIPLDKIKYRNNTIDDFLKNIKINTGNFKLRENTPEDKDIKSVYTNQNDTILIYNSGEIKISLSDIKTEWIIDEIKTGMPEEVLLKKFPVSTKIPLFSKVRFEDIKKEYFYGVTIPDNEGSITFIIKDKIIEQIYIHYHPSSLKTQE